MVFEGKTVLVTGGTGSFGNEFVRLCLRQSGEDSPQRVIIFSRDEKKQHDMRLACNDERLRFVIGDIRDRNQIASAMRGVDYVFHAAALKQVPSCEFFPMEAVQTNILGTNNVLDAAESCGVEKLVVLSTDKAVYPINAMGQTKALMEKLVLARAKAEQTETTFCVVRYGNVMYSRGSVIPLFAQQIAEGLPLTVTDPNMTRLLLPLPHAVELVLFALREGQQGDLLVRKAPTATIRDLAQAMLNLHEVDYGIREIGVREGEKMHEVLVTAEELVRSDEFDDYYRVACHRDRDYSEYFEKGRVFSRYFKEGYTSENARRLSVPEIEQLLLELPEIHEVLDSFRKTRLQRKKSA